MDVVVYESYDTTLLAIIEQVLSDNQIAYTVVGGADVGLGALRLVRVSVPLEFEERAKDLIRQITL